MTNPTHRTKLTPEVHQTACRMQREGRTLKAIAAECEVSQSALYSWVSRGLELGDEPYRSFALEFTKARAADEERYLGVIREAADGGDVPAARFILEKLHPETFGRQPSVVVNAGGQDSVQVIDLGNVSSKSLEAELMELEHE